jgi:TPP-dependent pyruvate/acetoin dehydrogenase alpha subunit
MMATSAPPDTARSLLRGMLRIRMIEERIKALYAEQEMRCPTHFSIGQEAAAVGVCARLTREELITSAHRSHAHYLAKGGDLRAMLAELYGKVTGCARGKGGSMHLIDRAAGFLGAVPIVGATIPIGVGAALASVMRGRPRLSVIFFGDAATETGVFHETLNFAAIHKLPIVMVCENNLYSVLTPLRWRHPDGREIAQLARGHGVPTLQGDGNDADVVHALAGEAVEHARSGRGPMFVELATYRWLEHCGPNDDQHLGYRPRGEFAAWQARDPLKLYTERLRRRGLVSDADLAAMTSAITAEIDDAVTFARSSPFPARQELAEHVYAP